MSNDDRTDHKTPFIDSLVRGLSAQHAHKNEDLALEAYGAVKEAYGYAKSIAVNMAKKYPAAPQWEPCDSLMGVLSQIDNMAAGLHVKVHNDIDELAYYRSQDGLLPQAQDEVKRLTEELAETKRPMTEEMAELNRRLIAAQDIAMTLQRELGRRDKQIAEGRKVVLKALRRAYQLGQTYWQQADSESYSQNKKSYETDASFRELFSETNAALSQPAETQAKNAIDPAAVTGCFETRSVSWDMGALQETAKVPAPAGKRWVHRCYPEDYNRVLVADHCDVCGENRPAESEGKKETHHG